MAQTFEDHVSFMVQSVLNEHNEQVTPSHFTWLHRMYSRVLVRSLELDRRESELAKREAALHRHPKKYQRGKNDLSSSA